ncbi:MAG: hypothetical protein IVW53_15615 [Chloroflexi bacterium]|nr:hypothetical protein [Chloroflexota bacterium]
MGPVELHVSHDEHVTINARCTKAELRRTGSGSLGLWVEHDVDERDLARFGDHFGYSVGWATEAVPLDPSSRLPELQLIVDSENFADEEFDGAVADRVRMAARSRSSPRVTTVARPWTSPFPRSTTNPARERSRTCEPVGESTKKRDAP